MVAVCVPSEQRLRLSAIPWETYRESERSKAFPFLPMKEFSQFLTRTDLSETQLLRSFRAWVRKQKKQGWKEPKQC
jgi:hypothetical protein